MQLGENTIQKYHLTPEQMQITMRGYSPLTVEANQFFLKEGQICNYIGFVTKGLLRSYYYDKDANEITVEFFPEGSLLISFDSFNNRIPAKENIKAIVQSDLMVISHTKQKELYQKIPTWNKICMDLADRKSQEMINRTMEFQTLNATERYLKFRDEHPEILQRATLGHIASYLGVDIATLSRIRSKK